MKRAVSKLLLLGIAGTFINIAIAWGCVWRSIDRRDFLAQVRELRVTDEPSSATTDQSDVDDLHLYGWRPRTDDVCHRFVIEAVETRAAGMRRIEVAEQPRFQPGMFCTGGTGPMPIVTTIEAGWPMRALAGWEWINYNEPDGARDQLWRWQPYKRENIGTIAIKREAWLWNTPFRMVDLYPWRPNPVAFALNTICYAALLWSILALSLTLRRRWRINRGRCPACAYPIGESIRCTECGQEVSSAFHIESKNEKAD